MSTDVLAGLILLFGGIAVGWFLHMGNSERELRNEFIEGRNLAIDNAAMTAYDMGHPDVRDAINALVDRKAPAPNPSSRKPSVGPGFGKEASQ